MWDLGKQDIPYFPVFFDPMDCLVLFRAFLLVKSSPLSITDSFFHRRLPQLTGVRELAMTFKSQDTSCSVRIEENVPAPVTLHGVMYSLEMFPNIGQQSHERLLLLDLLQTLDVLESRPLTRGSWGVWSSQSSHVECNTLLDRTCKTGKQDEVAGVACRYR